jgi:hypothetical protein
MQGVCDAAALGDPVALSAVCDHLAELSGDDRMHPFEVGEKYLICEVTMYHVGEIAEIGMGWIRLKNASWVHWTGRLTVLVGKGFGGFKNESRKPRSEYVGEVVVWMHAACHAYPFKYDLPKEPVE